MLEIWPTLKHPVKAYGLRLLSPMVLLTSQLLSLSLSFSLLFYLAFSFSFLFSFFFFSLFLFFFFSSSSLASSSLSPPPPPPPPPPLSSPKLLLRRRGHCGLRLQLLVLFHCLASNMIIVIVKRLVPCLFQTNFQVPTH